jgi:hypothetical protein
MTSVMRKLLLLALFTAACTPHPRSPSAPTQYTCSSYSIMLNGSELTSSDGALLGRAGWQSSDGMHYVAWPATASSHEATEFVIPNDPRQDAMRRTYDTTFGSSTADWRVTKKEMCTAPGGYNDILTRYIQGESLDDLTKSLALENRDETRILIRRAMTSLQHRYWRDDN